MTTVPILNYHSISDGGTKDFVKFTLPQEMFAQHMKFISEQEYTTLTVADYVQRIGSQQTLPDKTVVITFDDGFADFYHAALPVLQEFHFTASLFVVTGDLEQTSKWLRPEGEESRKLLTWSQLHEVQKAGIECGTHSATHIHLDTARPEVARQEISRSKETLEQKLGNPVFTIAYPYGHYTKSVRQMVIELGYTGACAVRNLMSHTGDDMFGLARITVSRDTDVDRLRDMLNGKGFAPAPSYEFPWVTGWRQVRRARQLFSRASR